jgi:hypothetical protein
MEPPISPLLFSMFLLIAMLLLLPLGRRLANRHGSIETKEQSGRLETVEAAVFALFGLLLAFAFSGAALRFNEKRALVAEEANAIGTAYLRLDLLSHESQGSLRDLFRRYVDSRLATYKVLPDMNAAAQHMADSKKLQEAIWRDAVPATQKPEAHVDAAKLLVPSLNSMFDAMTTRTMALHIHPPRIIYILLFCLALICSIFAGYSMAGPKHWSWLHVLAFAITTAVVVYVILDLEYPRAGLIRIEASDQFLVDLRNSMQ